MRHVSIKHVVASAVAVLIGVILAVGALGYSTIQRAVGLIEGMSLRDARQQDMISNLMLRMETNRSQLLQALQHNPATDYAKMHDHPLTVHFKNIADNTRALEQARDAFDAAKAIEAGHWDDAERILIKQVNPTYKKAPPAYDELQAFLGKRGQANAELAHAETVRLQLWMAAAIAAGVLAGVAAAVYLTRSIGVPLADAVAIARRVAQGDLSVTIMRRRPMSSANCSARWTT